jgi:tetratricopeptide (TPR) repeat protein/CHAT domain-containing protein
MSSGIEEQLSQLDQQVTRLFAQGSFSEAIALAADSSNLARHVFGECHPRLATRLSNLAVLHGSLGHYSTAESLSLQALRIWRDALGQDQPEVAIGLCNLASIYRLAGNYAAAEPLYHQALEIQRKRLGEEHPDFASTLSYLGMLNHLMARQATAERFHSQALEIRRRTVGESHPLYAASMNNLALVYESMGNYRAAEPLLFQAQDILRSTVGEEHPDYANSLNNIGLWYQATGKYSAAEVLLQQALEITRRALGGEHPSFAKSLSSMARLYGIMGRYTEAEDLYLRATDTLRSALGEEHPDFITHIGDFGLMYRSMGKYIAAESYLLKAVEKTRVARGEDNSDFAVALGNLGWLYQSQGNYVVAETLQRRVLEIRLNVLGGTHPDYATSLYSVATVCDARGNYAAAEPLYRQALEIWGNSLGAHHPNLSTCLSSMANLYLRMGNYSAAEPLFRRALEILLKVYGEQHPDVALGLNGLGVLYELTGNYKAAEPLLRQALEIHRKTSGEEHPHFAGSLSNLGNLYRLMGGYDAAAPLHCQAMEIFRKVLGEGHPVFATSLLHLAELYRATGHYAQAEQFNQQALKIYREALGEEHLDFASALNNLALVYAATAREMHALTLMLEAARIEDKMIGQVFCLSSESQRMAYIASIQRNLDTLLSLVSGPLRNNAEAVRAAFDLVLRRKAIGAEALAAQRDGVLGGRYPALASTLRELTTLRTQIALKSLAGPGREELETYRERLVVWTNRKERLEAELSRNIPEMDVMVRLRATNHNAVALALPERTVLVEFIRFAVVDMKAVPSRGEPRWKAARFLAFVMRAGDAGDVHMVDLGEAEAIEKMIGTFRMGITGEAENRNRHGANTAAAVRVNIDQASTLREAVFDPLIAAFDGCTRILISPDGDLSRLPFEVLPASDGYRLIDEYRISYLGSGRDVVRFRDSRSGRSGGPLVVADPDFDLMQEGLPRKKTSFWSRLFARKGPVREEVQSSRGTELICNRSRDFDPRALYCERLPGTRVEGEQVAKALGVLPWLGADALEGRLKECDSPAILHIATHGFFLEDQREIRAQDKDGKIDFFDEESSRVVEVRLENPLLRSGLLLAGFNTWRHGGSLPAEAEDGILTAEDVSALNLIDTDLVVLSACETGLGTVRTGEGVYGLRRAFMLAGTKGLIMSLWKVPDEETHRLMVDFYDQMQREGTRQSVAESLRYAQLRLKGSKDYGDPWYWGAFIYEGDPGFPL